MVLQLLEDLASQRLDSWSLTKCFCCLVASPLIMMNRVTLWPQGQLFVSDVANGFVKKGGHQDLVGPCPPAWIDPK